ncbi:alginate lyase family protein [Mucilaginibacter polytrichastri]|uniref:Alginate lyase domain-containing protein n=1 Tax=Mucilaginibacter polytrichastri TaxID=1302689 RepID=A0A1Q6A0W4_9SPHI|nr:alginate lyase family protein [Mucilaginibacter polytrichastri]OKS87643.1 hypothetical protein RG47T_3104 [Mucilaginibacter polytrichastri]SFS93221.1 Alginate lyase [Mucilaginibacter polytrichastri]
MKKLLFAVGFIVVIMNVKAQEVSLNKDELKKLKSMIAKDEAYQKVYEPLQSAADKSLTEEPNPIEKITSQGLLEGNPAKTASLKAVQDCYKVYALAWAYRISEQKKYMDKATEFLIAWAKTNKATGDPIDETKLEDMVTGYDLLRNSLSAENKTLIDQWFVSIADSEVNSISAKPGKGTAINNWNSHRIKMITLIAYTLHTSKYDNYITTELEKQLAVNLNADGTTHDFIERDAFHYHTYDIEPLLVTCIALYRATGKNYFEHQTPKGASIKKCADFMIPYMNGEKTHSEFVKSTVPFDKKRAENHEKGYEAGTLFEPKNGIYLLSLAAYFDPGYLTTIKQAAKNPQYLNWQLVLNEARRTGVLMKD